MHRECVLPYSYQKYLRSFIRVEETSGCKSDIDDFGSDVEKLHGAYETIKKWAKEGGSKR